MAVVDHVLSWTASPGQCAAAAEAWRVAGTGDAAALSALAQAHLPVAAAHPDTLSAFGLGDEAYRAAWTGPDAFDPALAVLLAWLPAMTLVTDDRAAAVARAVRRHPQAARPLPAIADRLYGRVPRDPSRTIGHLGVWTRLSSLERRMRQSGDPSAAALIVGGFPGDPRRTWLIINTLW